MPFIIELCSFEVRITINLGCDQIYATFSSQTNKDIFFTCVTIRNYETMKFYLI